MSKKLYLIKSNQIKSNQIKLTREKDHQLVIKNIAQKSAYKIVDRLEH